MHIQAVARVILAALFAAVITMITAYSGGDTFLIATTGILACSLTGTAGFWLLKTTNKWVPIGAAVITGAGTAICIFLAAQYSAALLFGPTLSDQESATTVRALLRSIVHYCGNAGLLIAACLEIMRIARLPQPRSSKNG